MKILIAHNEYGKYSGEEAVVEQMERMMSDLGHEVVQLRRSTAHVRDSFTGKLSVFLSGICCPSGVRAMRDIIKRERPDVVNVHNLYPFISPAALKECRRAGIPVIMTIHNFRLICPTGLFMRNGLPCERCLDNGNELPCVRYNCEQSMMKSIAYAGRNWVARVMKYYKDNIDCYACITEFQKTKLIAAGLDADKIVVIPNCMDIKHTTDKIFGDYVGYCGRLSYEKGVDLIIEVARRHPELDFKLAGEVRDGNLISELPSNVQLVGYLKGEELKEFFMRSRFMVMASRCYEGFPMSILEAAKYSKPTVAPGHGGFTEIIGKGAGAIGQLFTPNEIDTLESSIVELWHNPEEIERLGDAAHQKLVKEYSTEVIADKWSKLLSSMVNNL